ncbi:hypothetical protein OF377_03050 [Ureaplasma sp. ES3154-GEN]|uniref:MnuA family membrane nuclease n=1 Tax=Ureaplasma sp. ES3154-GEN TaxID=2984844 RepID=UPI0021E8DA73|nr:hypothetical protein [Ureaplasma sp. ES3154-GEN]MCV3743838.1 hypothetical protein [Ureaplasma sp. ES3154-GEN]
MRRKKKIIISTISSLLLASGLTAISFACAKIHRDEQMMKTFETYLNTLNNEQFRAVYNNAKQAYDKLKQNENDAHFFNTKLASLLKETKKEVSKIKESTSNTNDLGNSSIDKNQVESAKTNDQSETKNIDTNKNVESNESAINNNYSTEQATDSNKINNAKNSNDENSTAEINPAISEQKNIIKNKMDDIMLFDSYIYQTHDEVLSSLSLETNDLINQKTNQVQMLSDIQQLNVLSAELQTYKTGQEDYLSTYQSLLDISDKQATEEELNNVEIKINNLNNVYPNTKQKLLEKLNQIKNENTNHPSSNILSLILVGSINGQISEETYDDWSDQKTYLKKQGFLRLLNEVNKVKKEKGFANSVVLLNGSNLTGQTHVAGNNINDLSQGQYAALALSFLKPQASTINERDLLWSFDLVSNNQEVANLRTYTKAMFANPNEANFLSANLKNNENKKLTDGSKIINFKGHKIGIVGSSTIKMNRTNAYNVIKNLKNNSYEEIANTIDEEITKLKADGAEFIVWMTSSQNIKIGDKNKKQSEIDKIAEHINGEIDLVFGIKQSKNQTEVNFKNKQNVPYVHIQEHNREFVVVDLNFDHLLSDNKPTISSTTKKITTSGKYKKNKKGSDEFTTEQDLLDPTKNGNYHWSLSAFAIAAKKFLRNDLETKKKEVIFNNLNSIDLIKNQTSVASANSYVADLVQKTYQHYNFNFTGEHKFKFTSKPFDGVFLNSSSIYKNIINQENLTLNDIFQMIYFSNYFVSIDITIEKLIEHLNLYNSEGDAFSWSNTIRIVHDENGNATQVYVKNAQTNIFELKNNSDQITILIPDVIYNDFIFAKDKKKLAFKTVAVTRSIQDDDQEPIREILIRALKNETDIDKVYDDFIFNILQDRFVSSDFNESSFYKNKAKFLYEQKQTYLDLVSDESTKNEISNRFEKIKELADNQSTVAELLRTELLELLWNIKIGKKQKTEFAAPKLKIGHWNVLHQDGKNNEKNIALANLIKKYNYDLVALTEIMPLKTDETENDTPVKSIVDLLNQNLEEPIYGYIVSRNLEGADNQRLATSQHTSTERVGVIYKLDKVVPKAFADGNIGHIYSNARHSGYFTEGEQIDYSRPPYAIKFESKGDIVNDFTLVIGHFDSPGVKASQAETEITRELLTSKGFDSNKFVNARFGIGSREADNAYDLVKVIEEIRVLDNNSDDDFIFMGDTNTKINQEWWAFKHFIETGFKNLYEDSERYKTSLSNKDQVYANPYDKIFVNTNLKTTNPDIFPIWDFFKKGIVGQDWLNLAYKSYKDISWGSFENWEIIRQMISDHSPTSFELYLDPRDNK